MVSLEKIWGWTVEPVTASNTVGFWPINHDWRCLKFRLRLIIKAGNGQSLNILWIVQFTGHSAIMLYLYLSIDASR
jgi:hypothetical protein